MERAGGTRSVTRDAVKEIGRLARTELNGIGSVGAGLKVSREVGPQGDGDGVVLAKAGLSSKSIKIFDTYFRSRFEGEDRELVIVHEGSHAILGKSDRITFEAFSAAPKASKGQDIFKSIDSDNNDIYYGYRWAGVEMARQFGLSGNHNDTYVCQVMSGC
jgi:hypothetical protein